MNAFHASLDRAAGLFSLDPPGPSPALYGALWGELRTLEEIAAAWPQLRTAITRKLDGDYSLVHWDAPSRSLFVARSPFGHRPLYYRLTPHYFGCSPEVHRLAPDPRPNEGYSAEFLAGQIRSRTETLFTGIERLEPGHFLLVQPDSSRVERFWDLQPADVRASSGCEDQFRYLLETAVRRRLTTGTACELSGGLDSSAIAVTARVPVYSLVYPGRACDETPYIRAVVEHTGLPSTCVDPALATPERAAAETAATLLPPDYPNGVSGDSLRQIARRNGHHVLLSGLGGDECLTGSATHYTDLLRQLRLLPLFRLLRQDLAAAGSLRALSPTLRAGFRPLFRPPVPPELPPWLHPGLVRRTNLHDRLRADPAAHRSFPTLVERDIYRVLFSGWAAHQAEQNQRSAALAGVEYRYPFYDLDLISFLFGLPEEQRRRGAVTKWIVRQALGSRLPVEVRERTGKAEFSWLFAEALAKFRNSRPFPHLTARGWVVPEALEAELLHPQPRWYWELWQALSLECWLNAVDSAPSLSAYIDFTQIGS